MATMDKNRKRIKEIRKNYGKCLTGNFGKDPKFRMFI